MNTLMKLFNLGNALKEENKNKKKNSKKKNTKKMKKDTNINDIVNIDFFSMMFNNSNSNTPIKKDNTTNSNNSLFNLLNDFNETLNLEVTEVPFLNFQSTKDICSNKANDRFIDNINAIKLVNKLKAENRQATATEQKELAKYVGWGGLSDKMTNDELESLLGDNINSARKSVNTAFFTPALLIKYMWKVLLKLGFEKGRILDPSVGIGNFAIFSKDEVFSNSKFIGVEMDITTANIASQLLQSATIVNSRYEDLDQDVLKDESFDLVISNIPFSNTSVYDKFDKELNNGYLVHDYYFLKSIKKVRDKGIIAFITTKGVMDKRNSSIREEISKYCDFLGAVRLPENTFPDTSVVSDIIFLQKNINKESEDYLNSSSEEESESTKRTLNTSWINSIRYFADKDLYVNEYFINNPEMVIGDIIASTNQFGECISVKNKFNLNMDSFKKTLKYFPSEVYVTPLTDEYMFNEDELKICNDENIRNGEFIKENNLIYQKQGNKLIPNSYVNLKREKLSLYIDIKNTVKTIISEQLKGCSDDRLNELQIKLNSNYDLFIKKFGFINSRTNKSLLNECILYSMVCALENYDFKEKTYSKADIFSKRTIGVEKEFIPEDIDDAICLSFATLGLLDVDFMAKSLNRDIEDLKAELILKEVVYIDPLDYSNLIYRDEYLSGFVKDKLKIAQKEVIKNPAIEKNIAALKVVIPEYITDVSFNIASTWIPTEIKDEFVRKILDINHNTKFKILYHALKGYLIDFNGYIPYALNEVAWGTSRRDSLTILKSILNLGDLTVSDTKVIDGKDKKVKNIEETQLALNIAEKWKIEFVNYINSNPEKLKFLTDIYNERFNGYIERSYSNIFKSMNINPNITLREHQLKAISRAIQSEHSTLLLHSVGTGKSFTSISIAEERARIGMNKSKYDNQNNDTNFKFIKPKTLFIVPNHLCKSHGFAKEYYKLYPQANILACTPEDFKKSNRRKLIAKIALGDWTSIIIPYSVLGMIPLRPSTEIELLNERLDEINKALDFLSDNSERNFSCKDLEKTKENFETKIKQLSDIHIDDGLLYWEDLGITHITYDEMHNFKGLFMPKKLQIAGVSNSYSKRAEDLYNKIKYQKRIFGDNSILAMSATPISNTLGEMYTVLKFLSKEKSLIRYGLESFDSFASNFGEIVTNMEIDPTGQGFRLKPRFNKFTNLGELITIFREVADVVNTTDVTDLKIPARVGGKPIIQTVNPTEEMKCYIDNLVERAEKVSNSQISPKLDNLLKITNDGRKVALAPRLVGINQDSPKLLVAAADCAKIYKEHNGTQLLFCDLGIPKYDGSYSVYDELKQHMINAGIPEEEIKFIHDAKTTEQRVKLTEDFNEAKFKILIGSSSTCSEGVNFQKNIKSIAQLDVVWKPSACEQRLGRAFRYGNLNDEVFEFRYVTNSSFDAYNWQLIEFKSKFISQILSATSSTRVAEDLENSTLTYETCKACASNNPKLLELATVKEEIQKLQIMEKAHKSQVLYSMEKKKNLENLITYVNDKIIKLDTLLDKIEVSDNFSINLKGTNYTNFNEAIEILAELMKSIEDIELGSIYNLPLKLTVTTLSGVLTRSIYIGDYKLEYKVYPKNMLNTLKESNLILLDAKESYINSLNKYTEDLKSINNNFISNKFEYSEKLQDLLLKKKSLETELTL